jgi:hypothetical protein
MSKPCPAYIDVTTQTQLDKVVAAGDIPVCRGNGTFIASGSTTVRASGSTTVHASGSTTVRAYGSTTIESSPAVAVQKFGRHVKAKGGVIIEVPTSFASVAEWAAYYGVKLSRGRIVVFKAVDDTFRSPHGATYTPGTITTAPDWSPREECGNGLHFSPRAFMATSYNYDATKYVACSVKASEAVLLGDKLKAPSCKVLHEVDLDGVEVSA